MARFSSRLKLRPTSPTDTNNQLEFHAELTSALQSQASFTRVPVTIGNSVPQVPAAAFSANSREADAMRRERAAMAAAQAEPPSSQGSDIYSQPPTLDSHLVSFNRGQGFDSADDADGSYLEPSGSGFSAADMSTYNGALPTLPLLSPTPVYVLPSHFSSSQVC